MLKLLPIIIISSTIPLNDNIIVLDKDYSAEAYEAVHKHDIEYDFLLDTNEVDHKIIRPTIQ